MGLFIIAGVLAVSLLAPFAIRPLLERLGVVDEPNSRSSHAVVTLRGGGVSVLLALVAGVVANGFLESPTAWLVLPSILGAAVLGWVEDFRGLSVRARLISQVLIGAVGAGLIVALLDGPWILGVLGALALAAYVNVANFMDGVNGISALQGLVVGAAYCTIGFMTGLPWLAISGGALAVAFVGFLPWNVLGKQMFLGDTGSYLLGAAVVSIGLTAICSGVSPLAVVAPLAVYMADTGSTLIRRVFRGEPWQEAHRSHAYQLLTDLGFTHLQVAGLVAVFTAACALVGILALVVTELEGYLLWLVVISIAAVFVILARVLRPGMLVRSERRASGVRS